MGGHEVPETPPLPLLRGKPEPLGGGGWRETLPKVQKDGQTVLQVSGWLLMSVFDRAWAIIKMAAYKVGPTEFWDADEPGGSMGEHSYIDPIYRTKVMMKPQDYLRLASPVRGWRNRPAKEMYGSILQDYTEDDNILTNRLIQGMKEGKATFMPYLDINRDGDVKSHEGRHRMAAILRLLGNRPVPVQLSSKSYPDMRNSLIMDGGGLRGQHDKEQHLTLEPEMFFNVGDVE